MLDAPQLEFLIIGHSPPPRGQVLLDKGPRTVAMPDKFPWCPGANAPPPNKCSPGLCRNPWTNDVIQLCPCMCTAVQVFTNYV